jgi:hypothetical protein
MAEEEWIVRIGETEYRPGSFEALAAWYRERRVQPYHYVFNPVLKRWMYASEVRELTYASVRNPVRTPANTVHVPPATKGSQSVEKPPRIAVSIAVGLGLIILVAILAWNWNPVTGDSETRAKAPSAASGQPQPVIQPDFRIQDYILKEPSDLSKILGREMRRHECADLDAAQQIEYEHGYVCVQDGVVALIGYDLPRVPRSPQEALSFVGLFTKVPPEHPGGDAYMWSRIHGNALSVDGHLATRVIVNTSDHAPAIVVSVGRE